MADEGHKLTDAELAKLEQKISGVYSEAEKDISNTISEYFAQFKQRDAEMHKLVDSGDITEDAYKQWRLAQIGRGERYVALRDRLAERMTAANEVAVAYANDATPGIYSLNRNYTNYTIELVDKNADFTLWNEDAVRRMVVDSPDTMPYYPPDRAVRRGIDLAYGKERIGATVTSGILQGKTIGQMADMLQSSLVDMNRASAIRTARTAVTSAQNGGRQDAFENAAKLGINVRKRWKATVDMRTRHEHGKADGQTVNVTEPFDVGGEKLMFPGDSDGSGWNIYNCRCTMCTVDKDGMEAEPRTRRVRDPETGRNELVQDVTYSEWYDAKVAEGKIVVTPKRVAPNPVDNASGKVYDVLPKDYSSALATKFGNSYYDELHDRVVACPDTELAKVWKKYESGISVGNASHTGGAYCSGNAIFLNGTKDAAGNSWEKPYQVTFHESGHAIDYLAAKTVPNTPSLYSRHFSSRYNNGIFPQTLKQEVSDYVSAVDKNLKAEFKAHAGDLMWFRNNGYIGDWAWGMYERGVYSAEYIMPKYAKSIAYSTVEKEIRKIPGMERSALSDIMEGATNGRISAGYGHGKTYWKDRNLGGSGDGLATEAFAEFFESSMANPGELEVLKKYLPKSYDIFQDMIKYLLTV